MQNKVFSVLVWALGCALAQAAGAAESSSGNMPPPPDASQSGPHHPPGPPPEAIQACKGKSEGTQVSFTLRDGRTVSGTCKTFNGVMAAMPAGGPGGPGDHKGPPPSQSSSQ